MCDCYGAALPIPNKYQRYIKCEYCDAAYELDSQQILLPQDVMNFERKYYTIIRLDTRGY